MNLTSVMPLISLAKADRMTGDLAKLSLHPSHVQTLVAMSPDGSSRQASSAARSTDSSPSMDALSAPTVTVSSHVSPTAHSIG